MNEHYAGSQMSLTADEIASQPDAWRRAIALAPDVRDLLPQPGEHVTALGCGTSWFIAQAYAARRAETDLRRGVTDAWTPTEMPPGRGSDRAVIVSRSGTTTEAIEAARRMRMEVVPTTAITAVADSPLAVEADHVIVLGFADERSVVQTRFATSALALLRASLGEDLDPAIADAEAALAAPLPHDPAGFDHFVFLGHGWSVGLANEAALKLREACQAHTESYPAMEYRHGPISVAGPSTLVWILGTPDPTVADDIVAAGATVRAGQLDPLAELVCIHRTAVALAESRGLDPDRPRHLTRSVVLQEEGTT
jgi:fructoselysine-6-P-deglycase FrlB-like protein